MLKISPVAITSDRREKHHTVALGVRCRLEHHDHRFFSLKNISFWPWKIGSGSVRGRALVSALPSPPPLMAAQLHLRARRWWPPLSNATAPRLPPMTGAPAREILRIYRRCEIRIGAGIDNVADGLAGQLAILGHDFVGDFFVLRIDDQRARIVICTAVLPPGPTII